MSSEFESRDECVSYPFKAQAVVCLRDGHDVKPTRIFVYAPMRDEMFGRERNAALLVVIDGVGAVTEVASAAIAHFDECDFIAIEHHEIDLSRPNSVIARDRAESATIQIAFRRALGALAEFDRARPITAPR
jgi:hypothetical protein